MTLVLYRLLLAVFLLIISSAGSARAEDAAAAPPLDVSTWQMAPEGKLDSIRGGDARVTEITAVSATESTAELTDNRVTGEVTTGSIDLDRDALSNLRGIFVSTLNTGNNTSIQTNLTVQVRLGP